MIKFEIIVPNKQSTNVIYRGAHWSIRSKLKDDCYMVLLPFKGKFKITSFPVKITYSFRWKSRPLDTTNQTLLIKSIEDGMKRIMLLPDDDIRYVRETISRSSKKDDGTDTVEITIEPFY